MKRLLFIFFLVFFTSPLFAQETKPLAIGEIFISLPLMIAASPTP